MDDVISNLQQQFPSLSAEDAAKAAQLLTPQQAQTVAPAMPTNQIDPGNDTAPVPAPVPEQAPENPGLTPAPSPGPPAPRTPTDPNAVNASSAPQYQPEPGEMQAQSDQTSRTAYTKNLLQALSDPQKMMAAKQSLADATHQNFGDKMLPYIAMLPKGAPIASALMGIKGRQGELAKYQLQEGLEAAKALQGQENWQKDYEIKKAEEDRKSTDWQHTNDEYAKESLKDTPQQAMYAWHLSQLSPEQKDNLSKMSTAQLKAATPLVKGVYEELNKRAETQARLAETALSHRTNEQIRQQGLDEKNAAKTNKPQTTVDDAIAKEYADWTLKGGSAGAKSGIGILKDAVNQLNQNPDLGGHRLLGLTVTDPARRAAINPKVGAFEQQVTGAILPMLKGIFGSRIAQQEMTMAVHQAYNPTLSAADNAKNMSALISKMEDQAKAKQETMDYFKQNRTMAGYNGKNYDPGELFTPGGNSSPQTRTVNGVNYQKVQGGWQEVK